VDEPSRCAPLREAVDRLSPGDLLPDFVDALCHLELYSSLEIAAQACLAARGHGVSEIVCAGTDPLTPEAVPASPLVIHRAFGVHPQNAEDEALPAQMVALERRLESGAVALGECGLDAREGMPPLAVQERAFRAQLAIARRRRLPVILHLVRSHAKALAILEEEGPLPAGGVWHSFAGPREAVERALSLGLSLSVGALVFQEGARRLREALPHVPPERLLVETDAPHAALSSLPEILEALAAVRGVPVEELARTTAAAARRAYRLDGR
jgi:TatD DNase family protein